MAELLLAAAEADDGPAELALLLVLVEAAKQEVKSLLTCRAAELPSFHAEGLLVCWPENGR